MLTVVMAMLTLNIKAYVSLNAPKIENVKLRLIKNREKYTTHPVSD